MCIRDSSCCGVLVICLVVLYSVDVTYTSPRSTKAISFASGERDISVAPLRLIWRMRSLSFLSVTMEILTFCGMAPSCLLYTSAYDSRDVLTNPHKGYYLNITQCFRLKFLGNDYAFSTCRLYTST